MAKYRAGVIGLGWMGMMYDLAHRPGPAVAQPRYDLDSLERPTPELDVHRTFHIHDHPGEESLVTSYAEAFADRPDVELVAAAERDEKRLAVFAERYGATGLYTDAAEMLREARLDLVAIAINIAGRAELTALAVEHGVKGIVTEKPMVNSLQDADLMVGSCAAAGVPLMCGAITTSHPSFAAAKKLIGDGAIGELLSIEATSGSQHQNWSVLHGQRPGLGGGNGKCPRAARLAATSSPGRDSPSVMTGWWSTSARALPWCGSRDPTGEIAHSQLQPWRLWQDIEANGRRGRVEMPWPGPQIVSAQGAVYGINDVIDCIEGRLGEPKNSGRRVATALEVEIALKQSSARGGARVDLPLEDRSLRLNYDWFR